MPRRKQALNPRGIYEISIHERSGYIPLITTLTTPKLEGVQIPFFVRSVLAMLDKKERCTTDTTETSVKIYTFPRELVLRAPRKRGDRYDLRS